MSKIVRRKEIIILLLALISSETNATRFNFALPNTDDINTRIVGGTDVPFGEAVPFQVSLQYRTKDGNQHFCGGSIISTNRVLTAAHCCRGLNVRLMSVVAGIRDLNATESGTRVKVLSYSIHPDYKELVTSDVAILSIDPPLVFNNKTIAPVEFRGGNFVNGNVAVTLSGWGLRLPVPFPFADAWNYPTILQRMNYQTISNEQCRNSGMEDVTDTEICARGPFRGACSGDSGGPLVMLTPSGLRQVGIVSYGMVVCGLFVAPDVYTRVSKFQNWIQGQLE